MAVEKGDPEIVQLLLAHPNIKVNIISTEISTQKVLIEFKKLFFNSIFNHKF